MHPDLINLIWICGVIGAIILFFLIVIALILYIDHRDEKKYLSLSSKWEKLFLKYLEGDIPAGKGNITPMEKKRARWMWLFLYPYLESLEGDEKEKIIELSYLAGMQATYLKQLRRGNIFNRALASRILGKVRCREAIPHILPLLRNRHPQIVVSAAHSLADIGEEDYFVRTILGLLRKTKTTYEGATEIMSQFKRGDFKMITAYLEKSIEEEKTKTDIPADPIKSSAKSEDEPTPAEKSAIISLMVDVLGYHRNLEALDLLKDLLITFNKESEITIHIFKAFIRMDVLPEELDLSDFFKHENWVVRSMLARVAGINKDDKNIHLLESLLADNFWWVRYRTARTLWDMGTKGQAVLKRSAESEDILKAGVSKYILSKQS